MINEIEWLREQGQNTQEIATKLNVSDPTIKNLTALKRAEGRRFTPICLLCSANLVCSPWVISTNRSRAARLRWFLGPDSVRAGEKSSRFAGNPLGRQTQVQQTAEQPVWRVNISQADDFRLNRICAGQLFDRFNQRKILVEVAPTHQGQQAGGIISFPAEAATQHRVVEFRWLAPVLRAEQLVKTGAFHRHRPIMVSILIGPTADTAERPRRNYVLAKKIGSVK